MAHINIVSTDNGVGLSRSTRICQNTLALVGFQVSVHQIGTKPSSLQTAGGATAAPIDANIFLEKIDPAWLPRAPVNCLIPNQEWFPTDDLPYLKQIDYVLCKTRYAENIFKRFGRRTRFISFTSQDRLNNKYTPNYNVFFHLAGRSLQKGTKRLIRCWQQHPNWPMLTVVQHPETQLMPQAANIVYISDYLSDKALQRYQNSCGLHLCPSEAEGFGHYIVEGMSCQAVVVTTNAPPMNELVAPSRGCLLGYNRSEPQGLGKNYYFDPAALEETVTELFKMSTKQKQRLGNNARRWYKQNNQFYQEKLPAVFAKLLSPTTN